MAITGNIQHAAVLLNKLRTKPFYESKPGEMIWRLELWRFEKPDETWIKVAGRAVPRPLPRTDCRRADFDKKSLTLDPALGGVEADGKSNRTWTLGKVDRCRTAKPGIRLRRVEAVETGETTRLMPLTTMAERPMAEDRPSGDSSMPQRAAQAAARAGRGVA